MGVSDPVKALPATWPSVFSTYRILSFGGGEVVHGFLRPELTEDHPEVQEILDRWEGTARFQEAPSGIHLVLETEPERPRLARAGLQGVIHLALFLMTLFTTLVAGALLQGMDPLGTELIGLGGAFVPVPTGVDVPELLQGWPFALPLMGILLGHELGHYVAARLHRIRASLPYFIPFPPYYSVVGTLGAFIRLRSPMANRSSLLDVGAAGPIASFLLSIPVLWVGLSLSQTVPVSAAEFTPYVIQFAGQPIRIGDGLFVRALALLHFGGEVGEQAILLHPVAFAGWIGLFVTFLNLLPFGQLDGGHVGFAIWGRRQRLAGLVFLMSLIPMGFIWWGWWFWGVVAFLINRGRLTHPAVLVEEIPVDSGRRWVGWACVAMLLLTFAPVPVSL